MSVKARRVAAGLVLALAAIVGLAAVVARDGDQRRAVGSARVSVSVLLEDNTLLTLDGRGREVGRHRLGLAPANPLAARYLAVGLRGGVRVLVSGDVRDQLVYATPHGRVLSRIDLPKDVRYRAIEVGKTTGRTYLAGEIATDQLTEFGSNAKAAVLAVLSPEGEVMATETLRRPGPGQSRADIRDWQIYDIAVASNERRLVVSYHGPNTDGADAIRVSGAALTRCSPAARAACIRRVHGSVDATDDGFFAALGTPPLIGRFTGSGKPRLWKSGFKRAHLTEFSRRANRIFTVESCAKTGGMTRVDLIRGSTRILQPEADFALLQGLGERFVCGERISAGRGDIVAVMKRGTTTGISGVIMLTTEGRVLRWLPLKPAPVDLIVIP